MRHGADPDARDLVSLLPQCRTFCAVLLHLRLIPDDLLWQTGARSLDLLLGRDPFKLEVGLFLFVVLIAEASLLPDESISLHS